MRESESPRRFGRNALGQERASILAAWPLVFFVLGLLLANAVRAEVELRTSVDRIMQVTAADGEVETLLLDASRVQSGERLRYTIQFINTSSAYIDPGIIVITNPIPETAEYLEGTAVGADTEILFSVDGGIDFAAPEALTVVEGGVKVPATAARYTTIRWTLGASLGPGESGFVAFDVRLKEEPPVEEVVPDF